MRFTGSCPECGSKTSRYRALDYGDRFKGYRCSREGHLITVQDDSEVVAVKIPFKHLESCPECGGQLKIVSTRDYDVKDGVEREAAYVCEMGHWISHRQLIHRIFSLAQKVMR